MEEYLTTEEVAAIVKKKSESVRRAVRMGKLRGHRSSPYEPYRFKRSEVETWMNGEGSSAHNVAQAQERLSP